ncbi:hypothetical protein [Frigidibacter oleivorans]|uniref:hypothetical protein n=1 Tax=Frigidibacter oleivorans TaxID=2487129 RepID=UPI000F8C894E|nr:hypothetical protein [Frigidibacter oleivorans]
MVGRTEDDEDDASEIGWKIIEMAERLRGMNSVVPGAVAKWAFEMDGRRYKVSIVVEDPT